MQSNIGPQVKTIYYTLLILILMYYCDCRLIKYLWHWNNILNVFFFSLRKPGASVMKEKLWIKNIITITFLTIEISTLNEICNNKYYSVEKFEMVCYCYCVKLAGAHHFKVTLFPTIFLNYIPFPPNIYPTNSKSSAGNVTSEC